MNEKQHMLAEYITADIVAYLMADIGITIETALRTIYSSQTYLKLTDPETGLYLESSPAVYELYKTENEHGRIMQNEI